jgi:hypothetical protein
MPEDPTQAEIRALIDGMAEANGLGFEPDPEPAAVRVAAGAAVQPSRAAAPMLTNARLRRLPSHGPGPSSQQPRQPIPAPAPPAASSLVAASAIAGQLESGPLDVNLRDSVVVREQEAVGREELLLQQRAAELQADLARLEERKVLIQLQRYEKQLKEEAAARLRSLQEKLDDKMQHQLLSLHQMRRQREEEFQVFEDGVQQKILQLEAMRSDMQSKMAQVHQRVRHCERNLQLERDELLAEHEARLVRATDERVREAALKKGWALHAALDAAPEEPPRVREQGGQEQGRPGQEQERR